MVLYSHDFDSFAQLFLNATSSMVALLGAESCVILRDLFPSVFVFMEHVHHDIFVAAFDLLEMIIRVCWIRMRAHTGKVFEHICRSYAHAELAGLASLHSRIIDVLALLWTVNPETVEVN